MSAENIERQELTPQERRERRVLRREKQRNDNIDRAAKMHAARLQMEMQDPEATALRLEASAYVGCSGWFYWKWRGLFYPADLPTGEWFSHYAKRFDTVEINASFYSWPTVANVKVWRASAGKAKIRLHGESLRAHHSHQEVQRHKDPREGFWNDCRYPWRADGLLSVPASAKPSFHKGEAARDSGPVRPDTPKCS